MMRHSTSLILLLWLAMDQPNYVSMIDFSGVLQNARSALNYLASVSSRFPLSDIDAEETPVDSEAVQVRSTTELPKLGTEEALAIRLLDSDTTTEHLGPTIETPRNGDWTTSNSIGMTKQILATKLPVQKVERSPDYSYTTSVVPLKENQKLTPLKYVTDEDSKLAAPITKTPQQFVLESAGDQDFKATLTFKENEGYWPTESYQHDEDYPDFTVKDTDEVEDLLQDLSVYNDEDLEDDDKKYFDLTLFEEGIGHLPQSG
ncbi:uncharacterized protein LOC126458322 [Schistocerca serialis cubense]|uniref:uncharacterized protein LOC126458322 n=1 Tax=Schistocerca serialis cubense TaxID=2023355 RepID=UPI00214EEE93|nr:uncharacterized protein LOC126458322 [Schistocerca serialis cubense]